MLKCGRLGNIQPRTGHFVVELRDLRQALQSEYAVVTQVDCRNELGDARCGVNLTSHTHTGTVTSAASSQVFTDTSRTQTGDYFGNGYLTWTGGANVGVTVKIDLLDGQVEQARRRAEDALAPVQLGPAAVVQVPPKAGDVERGAHCFVPPATWRVSSRVSGCVAPSQSEDRRICGLGLR